MARLDHFVLAAMAAALMTLVVLPPAHGNSLDDVRAAVKVRDYKRAAQILAPIAESGMPEAQYQLAGLYRSGRGVEKDHERAFKWLKKASLQEHVKAQYNLGVMYEHGWGTDESLDDALIWYRAAATQGHTLAVAKVEDLNQATRPATAAPEPEKARSRRLTDPQGALQHAAASGNLDVIAAAIEQVPT